MDRLAIKVSRVRRLGIAVLVAVLHLVVAAILVRAFAPDFGGTVVGRVTQSFDVAVMPPAPPPPPSPPPEPRHGEGNAGAAAPAGRKATPREVTAPRPEVALARQEAPTVASTGAANASGARDTGAGTGGGGTGAGTGSGTGGAGSGGGGAGTRAVKIAGDIHAARDYPASGRAARLGGSVTLALTVGTDGRVSGCRIVRPGPDPQSDAITCRLASERFRFRPATDAAGKAVVSVYGWRQRWFAPGQE